LKDANGMPKSRFMYVSVNVGSPAERE